MRRHHHRHPGGLHGCGAHPGGCGGTAHGHPRVWQDQPALQHPLVSTAALGLATIPLSILTDLPALINLVRAGPVWLCAFVCVCVVGGTLVRMMRWAATSVFVAAAPN